MADTFRVARNNSTCVGTSVADNAFRLGMQLPSIGFLSDMRLNGYNT